MRLLLVEDDAALRGELVTSLTAANYAVDACGDGEEGAFMAESDEYDAIILDIGLPKVDGLTVLSELRAQDIKTAVLLLTARDSWRDKVEGLRRGADDYLAKPFHPEELEARLEALIRRSKGHASPVISLEDVEIDVSRKSVHKEGRVLSLSPNEFRTLAYLAMNRGRVVSKTELTEHIYDQTFDLDSNVMEVTVARLRKKVGREIIKTMRGHGYTID